MIQYQKDKDNIVILTLDDPRKPVNLLNESFFSSLKSQLEVFCKDPEARGLIITSGKSDFCSGADLQFLRDMDSRERILQATRAAHEIFRLLETNQKKPVVAAINGTCLGGGLELALACHYRIALDGPKSKIGFPEVTLGLLPGAGGTQRLPRLLPLDKALEILLEGKQYSPENAKKLDLVDEVVTTKEELLGQAKNWIFTHPTSQQPWDRDQFRLPGGGVQSPQGYRILLASATMVQQKTNHHYPAPLAILNCVYDGLQLPFQRALEVESQGFAHLLFTPVAKNLIRSLFFNMAECNQGTGLAFLKKDEAHLDVKKVGVLGAGMMGQGIAYSCARAGIQVILKDVSLDAAEKGKAYSAKLLEKELAQGKITAEKKQEILERIHPTTDPNAVEGCELVIEAVIEDRVIKNRVVVETEKVLGEKSIVASNTSTLPITSLSEASQRPHHFIGLHFFSPVEKMPLVEVISGEKTSDYARKQCFHFIRKIQKTPIFVGDGRGFYTSRVFMTYLGEGMALLTEGVPAALIENAGRMAGMPVGPLSVADEVGLDLVYHIIRQTEADIGRGFVPDPIIQVTRLFVEKLQRTGRKAGKGFYEYPSNGERKFLSPEIPRYFKENPVPLPLETVQKRLLYIQSLETVRCLEENILTHPRDADIGSLLGWGFPAYTGGTLSLIDMVGLKSFAEDCLLFQKRFGERFAPPPLLEKMLKEDKTFYGN